MFYLCSIMFDSIPAPEAATTPDDTRTHARLDRLSRLADIGVRIAERMDRQSELSAIYAETCAVPEHLHAPYARRLDEIGRAFAQVSRAVTLATALEARIETDLQAGPAARAEQALKRRLLAARVNAAEAPAPAGDRPASETPRAPDTRLRLDRALDPGLAALDAELDRAPEDIIARVRRDLDRAEALTSPPTPSSRTETDGHTAPEPSGPAVARPEDRRRKGLRGRLMCSSPAVPPSPVAVRAAPS
jgi:hypothetical protein